MPLQSNISASKSRKKGQRPARTAIVLCAALLTAVPALSKDMESAYGSNAPVSYSTSEISVIHGAADDDADRLVNGTVTDASGEPVAGAAVTIVGTSVGTSTDENGMFSLKVPAGNVKLQFSFLGMQTETVTCKGGEELHIVMQEDENQLQSVVVTGIFNRKSESYTGAAATFSQEQLSSVSNANLFESLKNLDASLFILPNLTSGSNPNVSQPFSSADLRPFPKAMWHMVKCP